MPDEENTAAVIPVAVSRPYCQPISDSNQVQSSEESSKIDILLSSKDADAQPKVAMNRRKRRFEKLRQSKEQRIQERTAKIAKAVAEGRDLPEERRQREEQNKTGKRRKRRDKFWLRKGLAMAENSFEVCLDCSFESKMNAKEISTLAQQVRKCYFLNREKPFFLTATSVTGATLDHLKNVSGYEEWGNQAFTATDVAMEEYYKDRMERVVYLTNDSETALDTLDNSKIYVIGGLADGRNRLNGAALDRARTLDVATARLPIAEHWKKTKANGVLSCIHVFQILQQYRSNGNDWNKAFFETFKGEKVDATREDGEGGHKRIRIACESTSSVYL